MIIIKRSNYFFLNSKFLFFHICGFISNLCTWRSMTTSMQIEFMRWVVFIQCLARCYISVLITVNHVIALATLSVSALEYFWKVENHRFLINSLKFLILFIYLNIALNLNVFLDHLIDCLFDNLIDYLSSRCSLNSLDSV